MIWRIGYQFLSYLATPWLLWQLWQRGRQQPGYHSHWRERFGFGLPPCTGPVLWLHAVSVGETRAAAPLIEALLQRYPQHRLLITQMTPTGRETARNLFDDRVTLAWLPYDQPAAVRRFLRHFRPQLGVLLETELWPNLIHQCARQQVPLCLLNARLSEKSLRGYQRITPLIRPALQQLRLIAAQDAANAARLAELAGIPAERIPVMGNLKFDVQVPADKIEQGQQWREAVGAARPVLVAACTRDGEEDLLLAALERLPAGALLVLVPRHPPRFDTVARLLATRNVPAQRRSQWDGQPLPAHTRVLLGDSLGELAAYYAMADVAFVGGSLLEFGAHSPIEPCAQGIPVLIGPSTYNFAEATLAALSCGAARQVPSADALFQEATRLLADPVARQSMSQAGKALVAEHRGAASRALALLGPLNAITA